MAKSAVYSDTRAGTEETQVGTPVTLGGQEKSFQGDFNQETIEEAPAAGAARLETEGEQNSGSGQRSLERGGGSAGRVRPQKPGKKWHFLLGPMGTSPEGPQLRDRSGLSLGACGCGEGVGRLEGRGCWNSPGKSPRRLGRECSGDGVQLRLETELRRSGTEGKQGSGKRARRAWEPKAQDGVPGRLCTHLQQGGAEAPGRLPRAVLSLRLQPAGVLHRTLARLLPVPTSQRPPPSEFQDTPETAFGVDSYSSVVLMRAKQAAYQGLHLSVLTQITRRPPGSAHRQRQGEGRVSPRLAPQLFTVPSWSLRAHTPGRCPAGFAQQQVHPREGPGDGGKQVSG